MNIGSKEWCAILKEGAQRFNISLDDFQIEQFTVHATELILWNKKMNLTTITDPAEIAIKHFIDSIIPVSLIPSQGILLDIGSGGGFPGLPLKVMLPSVTAELIDSSKKKVSFLNHVIRKLGLKNITATHVRAEDHIKNLTTSVDVVISRALSDLKHFMALASPFVSPNGMIVAIKGNIDQQEMDQAIEFLNHSHLFGENNYTVRCIEYQLPLIDRKGTIFIVTRKE